MIEVWKDMQKDKKIRLVISVVVVIISAFLQVVIMEVFMDPCNLISGGFTGISLMLNKIMKLFGINFSTSAGILLLNIPAAVLCYRYVSPRFTFLSCLQFTLVSLFLEVFHFEPFISDQTLNVLFGGLCWGFTISIALRAGGSTGGTDFIAQYVSSKIHKGIWEYVFAGNCVMYVIFGSIFGWTHAGYSIVFQFLSTKTISSMYHQYSQTTLEITTSHPQAVIDAFMTTTKHGMSVLPGFGGYSHRRIYICKAVVSSYECSDIIDNIRRVDPKVIINTYPTSNFYGSFYQKPIE